MYKKFYGFTEKPFEVTPDPKFLYLTKEYQEILSSLIYGVQERRGFIAVVGEVGTGKTLMLNAMLKHLDDSVQVAFIYNSDLTFKQMLMMALCDLGVARPEEKLSKVEAIQRLNDFAIKQLAEGGNVVIAVDEAQHISHRTMENLRMLSNLETPKYKLVQVVLCGQPELDEKLADPEWRQLVQRISLKRYSTTLDEEETYNYIEHRLSIAEYEGEPIFDEHALKLIWEYSQGIPRKINIVCDNALLIGFGIESNAIGADIIKEVVNDLSWSPYRQDETPEIEAELATGSNVIESVEKQIESDEESSQLNTIAPMADRKIESRSRKKPLFWAVGIVIIIILLFAAYFFLGINNYKIFGIVNSANLSIQNNRGVSIENQIMTNKRIDKTN